MEQKEYNKNNKINISVTQPQLDVAKGHFTYLVSGTDKLGTFQSRRRYNDFYYLRESLKKKFASIYIPPVPQKMFTGNKDQQNIELRRKFFQFFLLRLAEQKTLYYSTVSQQFIRSKNIDMQKYFTYLPDRKPESILKDLNQIYPSIQNIVSNNVSPSMQQKKAISDFGLYLKRADKQLKSIKNTIMSIVDARNSFIQNLNICNMNTLPTYQKNIYSQYLPVQKKNQAMVFSKNEQIQQNANSLMEVSKENSFQLFLNMIIYELRQIEAMEELFASKDEFQEHQKKCNEKLSSSEAELSKLVDGKTTFKSLFSKGNKDEQIKNFQTSIPLMRSQVQLWHQFISCITILIAQRQIPNFKRYKQQKYYQTIYLTSQNQLKYLATYGQFMKSVMEGLLKIKL